MPADSFVHIYLYVYTPVRPTHRLKKLLLTSRLSFECSVEIRNDDKFQNERTRFNVESVGYTWRRWTAMLRAWTVCQQYICWRGVKCEQLQRMS